MERIDVSNGLKLKAGEWVEYHMAEGHQFNFDAPQPNGKRSLIGLGGVPIEDCMVERIGDVVHVWAPGTEKNP